MLKTSQDLLRGHTIQPIQNLIGPSPEHALTSRFRLRTSLCCLASGELGRPLLAAHGVQAAEASRDCEVFVGGAVLPGVAARARNAALPPAALQGAQLAPA